MLMMKSFDVEDNNARHCYGGCRMLAKEQGKARTPERFSTSLSSFLSRCGESLESSGQTVMMMMIIIYHYKCLLRLPDTLQSRAKSEMILNCNRIAIDWSQKQLGTNTAIVRSKECVHILSTLAFQPSRLNSQSVLAGLI